MNIDLLAGFDPRSGTAELPVTRLLKVERDGNPLRRYGHVSPHTGKVAPLDADALREIADLAAHALPEAPPGPTLLVGMAESALLLSWFLADRLGEEAELRFTTREKPATMGSRTFLEPHSHGPVHALALTPGRSYGRVVIVEDELTSGATLRNLLLAIHDVAPLYQVVTLADRRSPGERELLRAEMADFGVDLSVLNLSVLNLSERVGHVSRRQADLTGGDCLRINPPRNAFGRRPAIFEGAIDALWQCCRTSRPVTLYALGECVDVAMAVWDALPICERPFFRHVTRSPWFVDGVVVKDRLDLCAPSVPDHFLYNLGERLPERAVIVEEYSTAPLAAKLSYFLASWEVETATVEVART